MAIAEALLIRETLTADEINRVMADEKIVTPEEVERYEQRKQMGKKWHLASNSSELAAKEGEDKGVENATSYKPVNQT